MKTKETSTAILILLLLAVSAFPFRADAAPAFARQTGMACTACHFQHFPLLNEFGRSFKAGGYTAVGGQSLLEGDILSLPAVLNASIVTKLMYEKTNGPDELAEETNRGHLAMPDEGALFIGGRVGEHIGFLLEAQFANPDMPVWANFKIPFVYEVNKTTLSFIPFSTDGAGPAYGFELLNTGAMRMQRALEPSADISAQEYIGAGVEATGFSFVASRDIGYVNVTFWAPEHNSTDAQPFLKYYRIALTPKIGNWDVAIGGQLWQGTTKFSEPTGTHLREAAEAWAVDAQAQGKIGNMPLGVYLSYGEAEETKAGDTANVFNSNPDAKTAFAALAELGVIPGRFSISAGWRDGDTGAAADGNEDAVIAGASFMITQNAELQVNYSWYDNDVDPDSGDQRLIVRLFAAF